MSMLDQLLSDEERVPCVFKCDVPDLGFLDTSNTFHSHYHQLQGNQQQGAGSNHDLPEGSKVELPLWLARELARYNFVTIELPKHYGRKMRDTINASALNLNLKEYSPYFFEVGMVLANDKKDTDLKDTLRVAFSGDRYSNLMVHSLSR
jgi:GINS complex subunit 3